MANVTIEQIKEVLEAKAYMPSHYTLHLMKVSKPESYDNEYGEGHYDLVSGDPKLKGTRGEHWSPKWEKIVKKYIFSNGAPIEPESLISDFWFDIETHPDPEERRKNITWAMDASLVSAEPFEVNGLVIDPAVDVLCMGGDENEPNLDWGVWPVKKEIFADTYELLKD